MPASHSQRACRTRADFCKNPLIRNPEQELPDGHKYKCEEAPERERVHGPSASISAVSETPSSYKPHSVHLKLYQWPSVPTNARRTPPPQPEGERLESTSTTRVSLVGPDEVKLSGSWEDRL